MTAIKKKQKTKFQIIVVLTLVYISHIINAAVLLTIIVNAW